MRQRSITYCLNADLQSLWKDKQNAETLKVDLVGGRYVIAVKSDILLWSIASATYDQSSTNSKIDNLFFCTLDGIFRKS
jgi:hypothetical protein